MKKIITGNMKKLITCLLVALLFINFLSQIQATSRKKAKPYLWVYWEDLNGNTMPGYISLCRKTLLKHCKNSFNIIELNEKNIHDYLPNLKKIEERLHLKNLLIQQKVDLYRLLLLKKYGGLYIDADIIVMKDLKEITDKLGKYDYVGVGRWGENSVYGKPANWLMASRPNGILIKKAFEQCKKTLEKRDSKPLSFHALGRNILQASLNKLFQNGYKYYQYSSDIDGTKDTSNKPISMEQLFSEKKINYKNIDNFLIIFVSNNTINRKIKNFKKMSEAELLKKNINFTQLVNRSLSK